MDNLLNFNAPDYEPYMFGYHDEEERKVHTPYVEAQEFCFENSSNIRPISSKIQFTLTDIAMVTKAKSRKTKTIEDPNSNKKCGHWSSDENKRYHWSLELHQEHFFNKHLRRTDRIFKSMASFVQTREAEQCRSHHQKMEKKYKFFSKILLSLRLQNYNADDHELIVNEMNDKGHQTPASSILTSDELRQIHLTSTSSQQLSHQESSEVRSPKVKASKSQNTFTSLPSSSSHLQMTLEQQNKQPQQQLFGTFGPFYEKPDYIDNIFNDTYEKNIDLGSFF